MKQLILSIFALLPLAASAAEITSPDGKYVVSIDGKTVTVCVPEGVRVEFISGPLRKGRGCIRPLRVVMNHVFFRLLKWQADFFSL